MKIEQGKIILWKDGSTLYVKDGITWEYENDKNWERTINLDDCLLTNNTKANVYPIGNMPLPRQNYSQDKIKNLQGKILTLLEATITEQRQLESVKDIVRSYFSDILEEPQVVVDNEFVKVYNGTTQTTFKREE